MYAYIKGIIKEVSSNHIVIDNQGIGYLVYVANPYVYHLDDEVTVYLYSHIREDAYTLYGFKSLEEKELFLKLINVKGVGPKIALPMLATGSVTGIADAIDRENILYLTKFPKIGEKLARQIILDLKGKLVKSIDLKTHNYDELISVLENLGYKTADIKKVIAHVDPNVDIETQVKEALKLLLK